MSPPAVDRHTNGAIFQEIQVRSLFHHTLRRRRQRSLALSLLRLVGQVREKQERDHNRTIRSMAWRALAAISGGTVIRWVRL